MQHNKIIDIHNHIIFGVDDGALNITESLEMIKEEIKQGVSTIICTPHYRGHMFEATNEEINKNFNILCDEIKKEGLPVQLFLGREIYYRETVMQSIYNHNLKPMNGTNYILMEFNYTNETQIDEIAYNLKIHGFKMIVAHIERYEYLNDLDEVRNIKDMGALIQINADSIMGKNGFRQKRKVMKLLKAGLVDFVASDYHHNRINYLEEAYNKILKKFGKDVAEDLFYRNAEMYLIEESEKIKNA